MGVAGGSATRVRLFGIPLVATEVQIREGLAVLGKVERVRLECYPGSQVLNGVAVAWVHLRDASAQHPATVKIGGIPTTVKVDKVPPSESIKTKVVPEQQQQQQQQQPGPAASKPVPAQQAANKPAPAPSVPVAEGPSARTADPTLKSLLLNATATAPLSQGPPRPETTEGRRSPPPFRMDTYIDPLNGPRAAEFAEAVTKAKAIAAKLTAQTAAQQLTDQRPAPPWSGAGLRSGFLNAPTTARAQANASATAKSG